MDIKIVLAITSRSKDNAYVFLTKNGTLPEKILEDSSYCYEVAELLFQATVGCEGYPYFLISQVGFIDDISEDKFLLYSVHLNEQTPVKDWHWIGMEELRDNPVAFTLFSKSVLSRR
jgi:hypothetical protein